MTETGRNTLMVVGDLNATMVAVTKRGNTLTVVGDLNARVGSSDREGGR